MWKLPESQIVMFDPVFLFQVCSKSVILTASSSINNSDLNDNFFLGTATNGITEFDA
jgi:hypothetical protein